MNRILQILFVSLFFFVKPAIAADCNNGRYINPVFTKVDITKNIKYARKKQSDGQYIDLRYDVYEPHGDTIPQRPVMLLIHGGAFLKLLDQNSPDIVMMCEYFAKRGYVTVSLDYRQEPNLLNLFSEESMVKAVGRALVDSRDAINHVISTVSNGNPYRIDTSKAFIGGVSAGAFCSIFFSYFDSLGMVKPQYQQWISEAIGDSADYVLRHRFDQVKPKAALVISGDLLNTNWVVNNGIDLFLVHGSIDEIAPYYSGYPLNLSVMPKLYGGKALFPRALNQGIRCEFEDWIGRGHVPFMNLSFPEIITGLINPQIFDSTMRHIAHFIYPRLDCDEVISGIQQHKQGDLKLYPNPNNGSFQIELPSSSQNENWNWQVFNTTGQLVLSKEIPKSNSTIQIREKLPAGMYFMKLSYEHGQTIDYYTGSFTVAE